MKFNELNLSEDIIKALNEGGTTVLLVEQNAKKALSIADRAYVLETGNVVLSGKAENIMNDDTVKKAAADTKAVSAQTEKTEKEDAAADKN